MVELAAIAHEFGVSAAHIYAWQKTGMLVIHGRSDHLLSDEGKAAWQAAIDEYDTRS